MYNELTKLATENSSDKRLELMNTITDMFITDQKIKSLNEIELFGDIFTKLLKNMDKNGKVLISEKFSHVKDIPKSFAVALIYEEAEVAAPMLQHSRVFSDTDLINVNNLTTIEHRVAVAGRINISEIVTDNLIGHGEPIVLHAMCSNETAHISDDGYAHMVRQNPGDGALLALLLQRDDLPKDIKLLLPHLSGGTLSTVERVANKHTKAEMRELMDKAYQERNAEHTEDNLKVTSSLEQVNQVRSGELSLDKAIEQLTSEDMSKDLPQFIAEMGHVDIKYVKEIIDQTRGEALTVLCRSIGMSEKAFVAICTMRQEQLSLPLLSKNKHINSFKDMDVKQAKVAIGKLKLTANI
ncbi:MAG: hypothetical protein COB24_03375 [Hyphomicrobiales bacterium]|nr:MAG: hypothetical protein COB24_03375 [Hyphomicrobiales bacterium]